jgi:hypothetical protein
MKYAKTSLLDIRQHRIYPIQLLGGLNMSRSFRDVVHGVQGRHRHNYNFPVDKRGNQDPLFKSRNLAINVTAGEVKPNEIASSTLGDPARNFIYWLGDANVWVSNISPHFEDHYRGEVSGVEFIINVDFDSPLDVAFTVTVEEERIQLTTPF